MAAARPGPRSGVGAGSTCRPTRGLCSSRRMPSPRSRCRSSSSAAGFRRGGQRRRARRGWSAGARFPLGPSELSKLILVVVRAASLSRWERVSWKVFAGAVALVAAPASLVLVQPDLGTTIVLLAVTAGVLFLGGGRPAQLVSVIAAGVAAIPVVPHLLHGYQRQRLEIFLDPSKDPLGAGYNLLQARIAVGSGGVFGRGWLHGLQGQPGFVPERATGFV